MDFVCQMVSDHASVVNMQDLCAQLLMFRRRNGEMAWITGSRELWGEVVLSTQTAASARLAQPVGPWALPS